MRTLVCSFLAAIAVLCSSVGFAQTTCAPSPANLTINICSPANGATVGTTFRVLAAATDSTSILYMQVYVAYQLYATQHSNVLDATITVPAGTHQNLTVQFRDSAGNSVKSTYYINVVSAPNLTLSPQKPTVAEGDSVSFTASIPSTWTSTCGSINSAGVFTAPMAQPSCKVTATASDGSGATATTSVTITSPISVSPTSVALAPGGTQQFTANVPATWSTSCGVINGNGLYTAPASGTCTITAAASTGTPYTGTAAVTVAAASTALNYTTWKNDNARDGLQSRETILSPANVNATQFGPLFSVPLDGTVWAQPLFMSNVAVGSTRHNLVFVATSNDSVYALDADNGTQIWRSNLLPSGETAVDGTKIHSSVPQIGIVGTPVIDPLTFTLYAVTQSVNANGQYFHRIHALDVRTGAEKLGAPPVISSPGWDSSQHLQRPGLLLTNGAVYAAFSGNGDVEPFHGWVFAFNAASLGQIAVWNDTPSGGEGGIWMAGAGIAADDAGSLYLSTGNGDWNGATQFGQSVVKLDSSLAMLDFFTPYDHVAQSASDKDLGSGGLLLLPNLNGAHSHEAIVCSKLNSIYVLDRDNLGQIGATSDAVIQRVDGQVGNSTTPTAARCFSTAAYWNNNVYFIGNNDVVKQFTLDSGTGLLSLTPVHSDTNAFAYPGAQPVVSANGSANGIVWAIDSKAGSLRAWDATDVTHVLYISPSLGTGVKFSVPTVVNGHVYVGLGGKLVALGLLPMTSCAPPSAPGAVICSPAQGATVTSPVEVAAAGTGASGAVKRLEIWVDGKKVNDYFSNTIDTNLVLASGAHTITAVEVDTSGAVLKSAGVHVTVQ